MADVAENPVNIPPPITRREPATVRVDLETIELEVCGAACTILAPAAGCP